MKKTMLERSLPYIARLVGKKRGLKITIGGEQAFATPDAINLPALPDDEDSVTLARGYMDHEAGHHAHTDFEVQHDHPFGQVLLNGIEDVREERLVGLEFPGAKTNLRRLFQRLVDQGEVFDGLSESSSPADAIVAYVTCSPRVKVLGQDSLEPIADQARGILVKQGHGALVGEIDQILAGVARLRSTAEAKGMAESIMAAIQAHEPPSQPDGDSDQNQGESSGDGDSDANGDDGSQSGQDGESDQNQGASPGDGDGDANGSEGSQSGQDEDQTQNQGASPGDGDRDANGDDGSQSGQDGDPTQHQGASPGDGAGDANGSDSTQSGQDEDQTRNQGVSPGDGAGGIDLSQPIEGMDLGEMLQQALEEQVEAVDYRRAESIAGVANEQDAWRLGHGYPSPGEVRQASEALRRRMITLVQAQRMDSARAATSGNRLLGRNLARALAGDPRIFERRDRRRAPDTAVRILVDASSSMDGDELWIAKQAAMAVSLAMQSIPGVETGVTAFPAGGNDVWVVQRPGRRASQEIERWGFPANGGTPLAEALWYQAVELATARQPRKILLVLTDGAPNNAPAAQVCIRAMVDHGIEVMGIGIGTMVVQDLFPDHRVINELGELAPAMFDMLGHRLAA